jgi:hypothetical protein
VPEPPLARSIAQNHASRRSSAITFERQKTSDHSEQPQDQDQDQQAAKTDVHSNPPYCLFPGINRRARRAVPMVTDPCRLALGDN